MTQSGALPMRHVPLSCWRNFQLQMFTKYIINWYSTAPPPSVNNAIWVCYKVIQLLISRWLPKRNSPARVFSIWYYIALSDIWDIGGPTFVRYLIPHFTLSSKNTEMSLNILNKKCLKLLIFSYDLENRSRNVFVINRVINLLYIKL